MKEIRLKIQIFALRTYINTLALFSEAKASKLAVAIFCRPRKGKLTDENRQTLSSATWETLNLRDMTIQTYRWAGTKPTILLAHGWESNAARWQQLIKKLRKQGFTVVALDAPAHGESGSTQFNAVLYAEMMQVVVERFAPVAIVGHSVGAFATAFFAIKYFPPSVSRLILLAPPSEIEPFFKQYLSFMQFSKKVNQGFQKSVERLFKQPLAYFSIKKLIKPLQIKGLIIHDRTDAICPFTDSEQIHVIWQGSEFIATEGYGHRLQNDKVNTLIVDYLKKTYIQSNEP